MIIKGKLTRTVADDADVPMAASWVGVTAVVIATIVGAVTCAPVMIPAC